MYNILYTKSQFWFLFGTTIGQIWPTDLDLLLYDSWSRAILIFLLVLIVSSLCVFWCLCLEPYCFYIYVLILRNLFVCVCVCVCVTTSIVDYFRISIGGTHIHACTLFFCEWWRRFWLVSVSKASICCYAFVMVCVFIKIIIQ